jgi:hypothetical protein
MIYNKINIGIISFECRSDNSNIFPKISIIDKIYSKHKILSESNAILQTKNEYVRYKYQYQTDLLYYFYDVHCNNNLFLHKYLHKLHIIIYCCAMPLLSISDCEKDYIKNIIYLSKKNNIKIIFLMFNCKSISYDIELNDIIFNDDNENSKYFESNKFLLDSAIESYSQIDEGDITPFYPILISQENNIDTDSRSHTHIDTNIDTGINTNNELLADPIVNTGLINIKIALSECIKNNEKHFVKKNFNNGFNKIKLINKNSATTMIKIIEKISDALIWIKYYKEKNIYVSENPIFKITKDAVCEYYDKLTSNIPSLHNLSIIDINDNGKQIDNIYCQLQINRINFVMITNNYKNKLLSANNYDFLFDYFDIKVTEINNRLFDVYDAILKFDINSSYLQPKKILDYLINIKSASTNASVPTEDLCYYIIKFLNIVNTDQYMIHSYDDLFNLYNFVANNFIKAHYNYYFTKSFIKYLTTKYYYQSDNLHYLLRMRIELSGVTNKNFYVGFVEEILNTMNSPNQNYFNYLIQFDYHQFCSSQNDNFLIETKFIKIISEF